MNLLDFVSTLLPSLERAKILEDISVTLDELQNQTLPSFDATVGANPFANGWKAQWTKDFQKDWNSQIQLKERQDNYLQGIQVILQTLPGRLEWIRKEVQNNFSDGLDARGLTYPKANMIALLQACGFASKFARKLLLATYDYELPNFRKAVKGKAFSNAELKLLDSQANEFIRVMQILNRQDLQKQIDRIPEVVVDINDATGAAEMHGHNLDPLTLGFLPFRWNPIYHIRLKISEWQFARYESAKAERQAIELRVLALQNARNGQEDPSVEQQINYYDGVLKDLNYKISKMED